MSATNLAISSNILWKVIEARGHDPRQLFQATGIDPELALDPEARISSDVMEQLQKRAIALLGDPCIGLKAVAHWHPSDLGALGYAWLTSSSLRTALFRLQRYLKLVTGIMTIELQELREGLQARFAARPMYANLPERYDFFAGLLIRMCRVNAGESLSPVCVRFVHEQFPCCRSYAAHFRCPVEFTAADNSITFSTDVIDRRLPGGNPQLAQLHDQYIVRYLARLDRDDIRSRVKGAILDRLQAGDVSDEDVAAAIHVSVRTLQRKLAGAGTSFRELVDETRQELAKAYIRDRHVSLSELAFMLGFSDSSAFSRAYRRWTGHPPSRVRAEVR